MALRAYSRGWRQVGSLAGGSPAAFDRVLRPSWQAGERPPSQIQRPETRAFAKSRKSDDDEKSWSEVAEEASHTAKSVFNKLVSSVKKIAGQDEQSKLERQRRKEQEELSKPPDLSGLFGGGLLGRAAGSMLGSAIKAVGDQMAEAGRQAEGIRQRATSAIEASSAVREHLGSGVQVGPPMSQSTMSSSINGRVSKTVSLIMPVVGSRGTAQAIVEATESGDSVSDMNIQVRMPSGAIVNVRDTGDGPGGPGGASGRIIDAEWKEVQ